MTALGRPPVVVGLLVSTALAIHPAVRVGEWLPRRPAAVAALLLLLALALVVRAVATTGSRRLAAWLLAAGAVLVLAGRGGDGLRGHRGQLDLVPGQTRTHFDEVGIDGRSLGLRPFDFSVGLEGPVPGGGVALAWSDSSDSTVLTPERAVTHGDYRFGRPRTTPTGAAARLGVEPERSAEIDVHREPLAVLVLLGALLVLTAVIVEARTP